MGAAFFLYIIGLFISETKIWYPAVNKAAIAKINKTTCNILSERLFKLFEFLFRVRVRVFIRSFMRIFILVRPFSSFASDSTIVNLPGTSWGVL